MISDADGFHDEDRVLVEQWTDRLTDAIASRLSDRQLERRLACITGRSPRLRDRLYALLYGLRLAIVYRIRLRTAWWHQRRRRGKALQLLDRVLREPVTPALTAMADAPPIEQIAAELRRLDRDRRSAVIAHSQRWLAAVQRAYDDRLLLACRALGLAEHLDPLEGIDRDIERVRIEEELRRSGLTRGTRER